MSVVIIKKNKNKILSEIKKNTPIIIFKKFFNENDCKKIISICHNNYTFKNNRKKFKNKYIKFASTDVLPSNVRTNRIFRTFELSNYFINKFKTIKALLNFQNKVIKNEKKKKIYRKVQVIHYPVGGGFFEEHKHPRNPTNYGFIITLSKKKKDFKEGVTNFKINKKNLSLEKFDVTKGDLILFKFDLPHSITPCDPNKNLTFDTKGRWTMVLPVYHEKF
jgi:hypothetical protein